MKVEFAKLFGLKKPAEDHESGPEARQSNLPKDWGTILVVLTVILFMFGTALQITPFSTLVRATYDLGLKFSYRTSHDEAKIAIINIDQKSLDAFGDWPWPRTHLADLVRYLDQQGASTIGFYVPLERPQSRLASKEFTRLEKLLDESGLSASHPIRYGSLKQAVKSSRKKLDFDGDLASAMQQHGSTFLPAFSLTKDEEFPPGFQEKIAPLQLKKTERPPLNSFFSRFNWIDDLAPKSQQEILPVLPLSFLAQAAKGVGIISVQNDRDGITRTNQLAYYLQGQWYPSLALQLAASAKKITPEQVNLVSRNELSFAGSRLRTDKDFRLRPDFYPHQENKGGIRQYSFSDVMAGKHSDLFQGQIVLVGLSDQLVGSLVLKSPVHERLSMMELAAHSILSVMNNTGFYQPEWADFLMLVLFLLAAGLLLVLGPALQPKKLLILTAGTVMTYLVLGYIFAVIYKWVVPTVLPAAMMVIGALVLFANQRLYSRHQIEIEDMISDKRELAIVYQQGGQLEQALACFLELPADNDTIYRIVQLGDSFDKQKDYQSAIRAYGYVARYRPNYPDNAEKLKRATQLLKSTQVTATVTQLVKNLPEEKSPARKRKTWTKAKRKLGRYTLEKQIGKGSMGVVYKGVDPRIRRQVAIKTLTLKEEFDAEKIKDVTIRFFNEANAAGKLNHPNIVTVYDVGEDSGLAYIAMEFLPGITLERYTKKEHLLPIHKTLQMVAKITEAISYAHKEGVVHRDIKPANIMIDTETNKIKVTDFGIAQVVSTKGEQEKAILGTPSYMSPEQLRGKEVDSRGDIFSLGVLLFELLTGVRPFKAETLPKLMYAIVNEPHPDMVTLTQQPIPVAVRNIVDKSLAKNPDDRYQSANEMRMAILRTIQQNYTATGTGYS